MTARRLALAAGEHLAAARAWLRWRLAGFPPITAAAYARGARLQYRAATTKESRHA